MSYWSRIVRYSVSEGVPKRSLGVAILIGTVLNLINQGDVLLGHGTVQWSKLLLTYAVPYFVATYGAVSYRVRSERGGSAAFGAGKMPGARHSRVDVNG
jgi:hypothetical protein